MSTYTGVTNFQKTVRFFGPPCIYEDENDRNHVDVEAVSVHKVDGHEFPGRGMKSFEVVYHVEHGSVACN